MKGIYLTEEGKKSIEDEIAELESELVKEMNPYIYAETNAELDVYKKIISYATILPVEESWEHIDENTHTIPKIYPNGVIIQPKTITHYGFKQRRN